MPKKNNSNPAADVPTSPPSADCPVAGIGASAGGMEAFSDLLRNVPSNTGMAYVLVQHLDPKHASLLPELLSKVTSMPVVQITDGMEVCGDHVYIIPPNAELTITDRVLHVNPRPTHPKPI